MRALVPLVASLVSLVSFLPSVVAGTPEAPEVTDPVGDCSFAPGNHYMDVTAVWISDETPTDLKVNIQLAEWIDPVGNGAGFAVQFDHQRTTWGVLAAYVGNAWGYGNGRVSEGEVEGWNDTTGSFQASPPVVSVQFMKANFPHTDPNDNRLVNFVGGSVDLKPMLPTFFVPTQLPAYPPWIECDAVLGDKPYVFQSGGHSTHDMSGASTPTATNATASANAPASEDPIAVSPAAAPEGDPAQGLPGPGLLAVALVLVAAALVRRK